MQRELRVLELMVALKRRYPRRNRFKADELANHLNADLAEVKKDISVLRKKGILDRTEHGYRITPDAHTAGI